MKSASYDTKYDGGNVAGKSLNRQELARRYAVAFTQILAQTESNKEIEMFVAFADVVVASDMFKVFVASRIGIKNHEETLLKIADQYGLSQTTKNFISLIIMRQRLAYIGDIAQAVRNIHLEKHHFIDVTLTVAQDMSPEDIQNIETELTQILDKKPILKIKMDKTLISGYIVHFGCRFIDNSLKTRLKRLHKTMKGVI